MFFESATYSLARIGLQRGIGLPLIAFICALNQFRPLLGERGLLPVPSLWHRFPSANRPACFF